MYKLTLVLENLINTGIICAFILMIYDTKHNSNTTQRMNLGFYKNLS